MTRGLRTVAGVMVVTSTLATTLTFAQGQPGAARVQPRPASAPAGNGVRPAAAAPRQFPAPAETKSDPVLDAILRNWEVSSARIKTLDGKHIRSRSNSVFATDARAAGEFHFEAPDKGRIDLTGTPPAKGAASPKKTKDGEAYSLTADRDEKWICDGKQVLMIDEVDKQYESIPLPEEMQGANIIESPLPFLFGMKAAAAKQRFQMELIHLDREKNLARITAIPLQNRDAQNFIRAEIVLDTKEYLPKFVSLTDPAGTITTQYIFLEVNVNNAGFAAKAKDIFGPDPFRPSLRGYTKVQPPPVVERTGGPVPGGASGKIIPSGGRSPAPTTFSPQSNGTNRPNTAVKPRFVPQ